MALRVGNSAEVTAAYLGSTPIDRMYKGGDLFFEKAFTPDRLFNNGEDGFWLDPSDFSTMWQDTAGTIPITSTGQAVARIDDKSGNGHAAIQSVASARPILRLLGGNYCLEFDGVNDTLLIDTISTAVGENTFCGGFRKYDQPSLKYLVDVKSGRIVFASGGNPASNSGVFTGSWVTTPTSINTDYVMTALLPSVNATLRINASVTNTFTPTLRALGGNIWIGSAGSNYFLNGRIYNLVVKSSNTTGDDLAKLETFIGQKSGLTI